MWLRLQVSQPGPVVSKHRVTTRQYYYYHFFFYIRNDISLYNRIDHSFEMPTYPPPTLPDALILDP